MSITEEGEKTQIRGISRSLYYDDIENTMLDEDSNIVFDIFNLITANDLYMFKLNKKSIDIIGVTGGTIEMIYPKIERNKMSENNLSDEEAFELINRREQQMLVHSYIYYNMDENIWTDQQFDISARELARLLIKYPKIASKMKWQKYFIGWDGTTGFNLPFKNEDVIRISEHLYTNWKEKKCI